METHQQFPTYYDIYSIYMAKSFKKLRKNKVAFIPKLLETLLETYPNLKRFVVEKSFSSEYLQKWLTKILYKMNKVKKRLHLSSTKDFFQISLVSSFSPCGPVDSVKVDQIAATTFQDCEPSLKKQPSCNGSDVDKSISCGPVDSAEADQVAPTTFQDTKPSLQKQPSCNGSDVSKNSISCGPVDSAEADQVAPTTFQDTKPSLQKQPSCNGSDVSKNSISCGPVDSAEANQVAPTTFQDTEPSLRKQPSCNGSNTRTFCVANVWAGFPTFGSIYSTSKLDIVQQLKGGDKEFIPVMLEILMKKYPRLKALFSDLSLPDECITGTLLYILRQAEQMEQSSCKQEKRKFFSTVFNSEILSNISKQGIHSERTDGEIKEDVKNDSAIPDIDKSVKESPAECTTHDSSSVCANEENTEQSHLALGCKPPTPDITSEDIVGNETQLHEYLKDLKSKYARTLSELAEKSNLEINLEKKLKNLLTKQKKYKYKIKRCRKEMTEFDSFKSICRS